MEREASQPERLPAAVRRFLEESVDSVEELEVILLLQHAPQRSWDAAGVADALRLTERRAAHYLETLGRRGLVDVRLGGDVRYRFNPATPELAARVKAVAETYREQRGAMLALLTTRRRRSLRDFSDAFRLTRDPDEDNG